MSLEPFLDFKKHFPGIFCLWNFEAVNIQFWDKARHHTILIDSYTLLTTFTLLQTIIISTPMSKNLERLENNKSFWRYLAMAKSWKSGVRFAKYRQISPCPPPRLVIGCDSHWFTIDHCLQKKQYVYTLIHLWALWSAQNLPLTYMCCTKNKWSLSLDC